jgi:thiol:disulfide interchange protein DsbC
MIKKYKVGILILFFFTMLTQVLAEEKNSKEAISANLKKQFPELTIDSMTPAAISGLFEVSSNGNIFYVTNDGRYIVSGDIIDLKEGQKNLTENTRKTERLKAISKFGENNMIIFSPKKPKYTLTVFTDVDCGYCRKFHSEITKMNDLGIAVRYIPFPRSGPNSETFNKMQSVWCAKDKKQALGLAKTDKFEEKNSCPSTAVKEGYELGVRVGVRGTPTLILDEGTLLPGFYPPEKLIEILQKVHTKS